MYQNSLEEYMKSVLGYQMPQNNTYCENQNYNCINTQYMGREQNNELEQCYPEIYKIVYPMVKKACSQNTKPITKELVEELTNEIFLTVESSENTNININLTNEVNKTDTKTVQNRTTPKVEVKETSNKRETRQSNYLLNDLIRVLIIRELLGRPSPRPPFPGNRPPFPPGRPPFPGPGPRPPIRPREFDENYFEI